MFCSWSENLHVVWFDFSSPEPLVYGELLCSLNVWCPSSVVNNCFKGHILLKYWLDLDLTWQEFSLYGLL